MDIAPFYAWVHDECLVSPRVSGNVSRLWRQYNAWCARKGFEAERFAFVQALSAEFGIVGGLAAGISLRADCYGYRAAYAPADAAEALIAIRRMRVDFLKPGLLNREAA